jgi:LysM repeat protein
MLKEGSWDLLEHFSENLRVLQLYGIEMYRDCLVAYATRSSSKIAADLLWRYEREYVLKRLDDDQILAFLDAHTDRKERAEFLAKELLLGLRSDFVRRRAAEVLYAQAGEAPPEVYDHADAVRRFCKVAVPPVESVALSPPSAANEQPAAPRHLIHVVQERDSLWKLSRKYQVSVEALMNVNGLENDRLRIGRELRIPLNEP